VAKTRAVADVLYRHSRQAVAANGRPVLVFDDARQRGATFGERLANAFADAFAEGYDRVIAVGSDCPRLGEVDWDAVDARLQAGRPVLGPTQDRRGTYLIGLSQAQFDAASFARLPWQTSQLFDALVAHLTAPSGESPVRLAPRADVNDRHDLLAFLDAPGRLLTSLADRLRVLLGRVAFGISHLLAFAPTHVCVTRGRGPPAVR